MSRFRRLDGGQHGLPVPQLPDQDTIGVLSYDESKCIAEVRYINADLTLRDNALLRLEPELDGVFNGNDVHAAIRVDVVQHGGERRALAAARHAADEYESVIALRDRLPVHLRQMQRLEVRNAMLDATKGRVHIPSRAEDVYTKAVARLNHNGKVETALLIVLGLPARRDQFRHHLFDIRRIGKGG